MGNFPGADVPGERYYTPNAASWAGRVETDVTGYPILVVVVAYGSEEHLASCLEALGSGVPAVVVDNGGSDRAKEISRCAGAAYVRPHSNVGFAAGVNLALRRYRQPGTDVLLLNPDARLTPHDLDLLRREIHRVPDLVAIAPALTNPNGLPQRVAWPMPSPWTAIAGVIGVSAPFRPALVSEWGRVALAR